MAGNTVAKLKNLFLLMLLTNLIIIVAGRAGIRAGVVVHMTGYTLSIGIPMIQWKVMIEGGIMEIRCILMARNTSSRKMVG
jgi:hypothetical protein